VFVLLIKIQQVGELVCQRPWVQLWHGVMLSVMASVGDPFLRLQPILMLLFVTSSRCWKHGSLIGKVFVVVVYYLLQQRFESLLMYSFYFDWNCKAANDYLFCTFS
jgi:hypothetical protein